MTDGLMPLMSRGARDSQKQAKHDRGQPEPCVVNVSSGDGEVAFLCSGLQEALRSAQRVEQLDALAEGLVDMAVLSEQELAFGPTPAYR